MNTHVSAGIGAQSSAPTTTGSLARLAALAVGGSKKKVEEDEAEKKDNGTDSEDKKDDEDAEKPKDDGEEAEDKKDDEDAEDEKPKEEDTKAGDDDSDEDDKADKAKRTVRERGRIAAILTSKAASRSEQHYAMALQLALRTSMTRGESIAVLGGMPVASVPAATAAPAVRRDELRSRMEHQPNPEVGADNPSAIGGGPSLAAQIIAAGKKRRGEKD